MEDAQADFEAHYGKKKRNDPPRPPHSKKDIMDFEDYLWWASEDNRWLDSIQGAKRRFRKELENDSSKSWRSYLKESDKAHILRAPEEYYGDIFHGWGRRKKFIGNPVIKRRKPSNRKDYNTPMWNYMLKRNKET